MNTRADEHILARRGFQIAPGEVSDERCFQLQELRPGAREGSCLMGFGRYPQFAALLLPPKKRQRFSNPCPCRPSLASDASEVLCQHLN
jgi:hypothetical protein